MEMKRIVILGGGYAGAFCARELERIGRGRDFEIVLMNMQNYFVFTPLLIEAGIGRLEPRHAVVPLRDFLKRTQFRAAEVTGYDPHQQRVYFTMMGRGTVEAILYDQLVVALGSVTKLPPVPEKP